MSLLSHGAEPSRWETHHILTAPWKELCLKKFLTHEPCCLTGGGWLQWICSSFQSNCLSATTAGAKEEDEPTCTGQLAP